MSIQQLREEMKTKKAFKSNIEFKSNLSKYLSRQGIGK